jgi:hypothetical protein
MGYSERRYTRNDLENQLFKLEKRVKASTVKLYKHLEWLRSVEQDRRDRLIERELRHLDDWDHREARTYGIRDQW